MPARSVPASIRWIGTCSKKARRSCPLPYCLLWAHEHGVHAPPLTPPLLDETVRKFSAVYYLEQLEPAQLPSLLLVRDGADQAGGVIH